MGREMSFMTFIMRPEVWFVLGLAGLVIVLGLVLARGTLTGGKVFGVVSLFFGVIIAVNLVLANRAVSTFPGLEVTNSYIASQSFDVDRAAQKALGWNLVPEYDGAAKELRLAFTDPLGFPAEVTGLSVMVGRATEARDDSRPEFVREAGVFVAPLDLQPGKWMMQIEAFSKDGTPFRQRIDLMVRR
ncbi:Nitrogen fixation protein FixH [Pseudorhodobacter antarcticus]|jgi:nitrogen fixation protein FixH|uniref:Nitrogen fixation protein FixH n=2 Tax=Pseudorhodobacter antarcticus TaxID=1077947 RepID=A0A1H8E3R5_9RHOB|nr:Nitrogen fixation protein FixH [Pseudorhodobacter antarcticus]